MASKNQPSSGDYAREAEATRGRLAHSLDELSDRLTPGQVFDEMLTYAKGGGGTFFRAFTNAARENPMPSLLIGAGCMMFLSEKMGLNQLISRGNGDNGTTTDYRSRVSSPTASGASSVAQSVRSGIRGVTGFANEQAAAAGGGIKQGAVAVGEAVSATAGNLRDQASDAAGTLVEGAQNVAESVQDYSTAVGRQVTDSAKQAGRQATRAAGQAKDAAQSFIHDQPLLCAAIGLTIGAAIAAMLPSTEAEDELMGETSDSIKKAIAETASEQFEVAKGAAGNVAQEARAAAEREGLTPAGATDVARNFGEKIKRVVTDAGTAVGGEVRDFTKSDNDA
jgi:ElaB/YqjD/DUF883 family membrane-anchored ribosome-binding protein